MVLNYPSKSQKYNQTKVHKSMSSTTYPTQDQRYINKMIPINFKSESKMDAEMRLIYSENSKEYKLNTMSIFLVVRFDLEYPNKAILVNSMGVVIVTSTDKIRSITTPKGVEVQNRLQESSTFFGRKYVDFNYTDMYDPTTEYVELFPAQDYEFLGLLGFTEYENDLSTKASIKAGASKDQPVEQESPNYHSIMQRYQDVINVYPVLGDILQKERVYSRDYMNNEEEEDLEPVEIEPIIVDFWNEDHDGKFDEENALLYDFGDLNGTGEVIIPDESEIDNDDSEDIEDDDMPEDDDSTIEPEYEEEPIIPEDEYYYEEPIITDETPTTEEEDTSTDDEGGDIIIPDEDGEDEPTGDDTNPDAGGDDIDPDSGSDDNPTGDNTDPDEGGDDDTGDDTDPDSGSDDDPTGDDTYPDEGGDDIDPYIPDDDPYIPDGDIDPDPEPEPEPEPEPTPVPDPEPEIEETINPSGGSVDEEYKVIKLYPTKLLHPEVVAGFKYSHYIHDKNYIDKPYAARNIATIIRADRNRDHIVVMERVVNDGITYLRFLTGEEIYFYYNSRDQFKIGTHFDMENIVKEIRDGNIQGALANGEDF